MNSQPLMDEGPASDRDKGDMIAARREVQAVLDGRLPMDNAAYSAAIVMVLWKAGWRPRHLPTSMDRCDIADGWWRLGRGWRQRFEDAQSEVDRLRAENTAQAERLAAGEASDGYHTHNELYDYRMLYNAHAAMGWLADGHHVVKSWYHSDGEPCFGGGWFVVVAELSTGQVTNHYEAKHWGLFNVPEELPPAYDGHTPAEAAERLRAALGLDQDGNSNG